MNYNDIQIIRNTLKNIDNGSWEITGPVARSRESDIYKASSEKTGLVVAAKKYFDNVNPGGHEQQAKALISYQASMSCKGQIYRVPKFFLFDVEQSLLIMEWISGGTLHEHLWSIRNKSCLLQKTGEWLRSFHDASSIYLDDIHLGEYLERVKRQVLFADFLKGEGRDACVFKESFQCLSEVVSGIGDVKLPHTVLHGDFTPFNIILVENKIVGLDLGGNVHRPVFDDLVRMIVYLTIAYPLTTLQSVCDARGNLQKNLIPLLEGYGQSVLSPILDYLKIALFSEYLRRWLVIANRQRTLKRLIFDKYQIMNVKRQICCLRKYLS